MSDQATGADEVIDLRAQVVDLREQLDEAQERLRSLVERSTDGAMVIDEAGMVVYANPAAQALLSRTALIGEPLGLPVTAGDVTEVELLIQGAGERVAEMRLVDTEWNGRPATLALLRDVTEQRRSQAELAHRATHDALTGLPNRYLFEDRLRQALARLRREHDALAVVFADLDGFKAVNDRFGHAFGDEVLVESARRLSHALRPSDTAARLGGDEFVILCEDIDDAAAVAGSIVKRIRASFSTPMTIRGVRVVLGISLGVATTEDPDCPLTDLLDRADAAMYAEKQARREEV
jgi:diguanylate cyclase (GGDEF)-like protein